MHLAAQSTGEAAFVTGRHAQFPPDGSVALSVNSPIDITLVTTHILPDIGIVFLTDQNTPRCIDRAIDV